MSPSEEWGTEDGVHAIADDLAAAAERAAGHGLRVGYHNHHWELANVFGGRTALELFAERAGPEVVLELDTYWAAVGGQDVPALLGRLGDRVRLLHLKDGPITRDNEQQLPLGGGAMPVAAILAAASASRCASSSSTRTRATCSTASRSRSPGAAVQRRARAPNERPRGGRPDRCGGVISTQDSSRI